MALQHRSPIVWITSENLRVSQLACCFIELVLSDELKLLIPGFFLVGVDCRKIYRVSVSFVVPIFRRHIDDVAFVIAHTCFGCAQEYDRVITIAAMQLVDTLAAVDRILSGSTENRVISGVTLQQIIAVAALDLVIAVAAIDCILAAVGVERIVATPPP